MISIFFLIAVLFSIPLIAIALIFIYRENKNLCQQINILLILVWFCMTLIMFYSANKVSLINVGNWQPPFGIQLVMDSLNTFFLCIFGVTSTSILIYSTHDNSIKDSYDIFSIGFWLILLGIMGLLLTEDLFNIYVWSELILISSIILMLFSNHNNFKKIHFYAIFNILTTLLLLLSITYIYGIVGSLSLESIAKTLSHHSDGRLMIMICLLLLSFLVKAGTFPFNFWLPMAYPYTSGTSMMLLSSMVTKSILIVILKLLATWIDPSTSIIRNVIIMLAIFTMFVGVMAAASQKNMKHILCYHITSQIGYIVLAIAIPGMNGLQASVFFLAHNILVKTNLLLIADIIETHVKHCDVYQLGDLISSNRVLAVTFFVMIMSLAGFPPFSGFWAKFLVLITAIEHQYYISAFFAIFVGLFTLYSMLKMWRYAFCENSNAKMSVILKSHEIIPMLLLLVSSIALGLYPDIINRYVSHHSAIFMKYTELVHD